MQLLVTFQAAPYLAFVVLCHSPSCFGPPVGTMAVSSGEDTCLGTVHLMVGALPVDPNLKFQVQPVAHSQASLSQ